MNHSPLSTMIFAALLSVTSLLSADVVNLVQNGQFKEYTGTPLDNYGYLVNGSTNTNPITNWTVTQDTGSTFSFGIVKNTTPQKNFASYTPQYIGALGSVLFVQRSGSTTGSVITQTITGLEIGKTYFVNYLYGARNNKTASTSISSTLGNEVLLDNKVISNNVRYLLSKTFTATNENTVNGTATFSISMTNPTGDIALLIQNVVIKEVNSDGWKSFSACTDASSVIAGEKYTHAVHFQPAAGSFTKNGVQFDCLNNNQSVNYFSRTGGSAIANVVTNSGFQEMGNGFFPFTANNDYIELQGLLPGFKYETTLYSNQWGTNRRQALITVNGEDPFLVRADSFDGADGTNKMSTLVWQGAANDSGVLKFQYSDPVDACEHLHGVANRFISAPEGVILGAAFSGTNAQLSAAGTPIGDTKVDTFSDSKFISDTWTTRGTDTDSILYSAFSNQECAQLGDNSALLLDIDSGAIIDSGAKGLQVSASIALATIAGDNQTAANGVGMGFFGDTAGTNAWDGFSGLVIAPDGVLYFYDGTASPVSVAYNGTWDANAFHNLTLLLEYNQDDETKATLTGVSFEGSTADYSTLLGSVFTTTDYFGLVSSSTVGGKGYADNLVVSLTVPEPSAWALLILGALGLLGLRLLGVRRYGSASDLRRF